ncbi:MAG: protein-glutamate O-methyltransferase CheR [Actinomycetota bacterium]|nr:protein-glutamate O-methyltransferase CheR [Actinomycetota bacterium]MDD5667164.1 protein-glutamate O-methyltransferase CheR [Actinomycetota bacterium]
MNGSDLKDKREAAGAGDAGLDMLLRQLHEDIGLNLKQYKPNYLKRRIGVRMRATGCSDYLQYRRFVKEHREEGKRLINDLTINVTEFFRDPDVYEAIRKQVIPAIMQYKRESRTSSLRAWSAGCATGEEPYSLAILFQHALESEPDPRSWTLRITATDLDDKALEKAREGRYESAKVPTGLAIEDYFDREGDEYVVKERVKRPVRFLLMDIVRQPPLRHLDLILCRNVLIYFEREKQQRILDIFRQCLRPGGFLVLGKSEAILGPSEGGLVPFSRRERVYRKEGYQLMDNGSRRQGAR